MSVVAFPARPRWPHPAPAALAHAARVEEAGEAMAHALEASGLTLDERIDALAALVRVAARGTGIGREAVALAVLHSATLDGPVAW